MLLEEQRFLHEDLERLEQGISDRVTEDPKRIRDRLNRDHQIAGFLTRIEDQSKRLLDIYNDTEGLRAKEIQEISTGDPFEAFYRQLDEIKDFHKRYPTEPVENLERAYKRKAPGEGESATAEVDNMFTGEEAFGRFLDLTLLHEDYLNIPNNKRVTYLQYLQIFDKFTPPHLNTKCNKRTDQYFGYVGRLAEYLENFLKRTRPLEDLDKLFTSIDEDFEKAWSANEVPGWSLDSKSAGSVAPATEGTGEGIWCPECEKEFKNDNVYRSHLSGKKHIKAAEARKASSSIPSDDATKTNGHVNGKGTSTPVQRLKDRAIAEREYRIQRLASSLESIRAGTRVNVERKQGMTERERQIELEAFFAESWEPAPQNGRDGEDTDSEGEEKIYNPLKLPLAWDGKPIPYWLYKLHGLGVEFSCEICGNFVYMGRRAFDKHFNESRHIYGLKCLGITQTALFREITGIEDALKLWDKIQRDKAAQKRGGANIVQMEDAEGNVMPEKVYLDLQKQGLL
ncbi:MAG: hypothetical protein Q9163_004141 [Psora crenata]